MDERGRTEYLNAPAATYGVLDLSDDGRRLAVHVGFLRAARDAPPAAELERAIAADLDNLDARYQLSAVRLVANDYEAAMQQLLEIAARGDGAPRERARHGLEALFGMLGEDDERVVRYRQLLQETMH